MNLPDNVPFPVSQSSLDRTFARRPVRRLRLGPACQCRQQLDQGGAVVRCLSTSLAARSATLSIRTARMSASLRAIWWRSPPSRCCLPEVARGRLRWP